MHTTTSRSLHRTPGGACIIDTPACARCAGHDAATLAGSYADIESLAAMPLPRCRHADEPGCAVREGVDADRLRNYHKLCAKARDTLTPLDRQKQAALWKARDAPRMRG
jgi:ribosome biogenesis GTPase